MSTIWSMTLKGKFTGLTPRRLPPFSEYRRLPLPSVVALCTGISALGGPVSVIFGEETDAGIEVGVVVDSGIDMGFGTVAELVGGDVGRGTVALLGKRKVG